MTLADLQEMDRAALLGVWSSHFRTHAPKSASRPFLLRTLAFEIQARARGGLPKAVERALAEPGETVRKDTPGLKPGGRLVREWNGVTHVVDVTEGGFDWNGQSWRSLSVIAREITGAHWSGPRFFGLMGRTRP